MAEARPLPVEEGPLQAAARILAESPEVALACHVNPDPDALGSLLGLGGHLAERGTKVVASWGNEPFRRPRLLEVLPGAKLVVPPKDFPRTPPVLVTLDTASAERLGSLTSVLRGAGTVICVDHHVTNPGFGTVNLIEPSASSTAEIAYRLILAMGDRPSAATAECLYAGILTDTGRFQYEATTPETLRVAAELRETGFDHVRLGQVLFEDGSAAALKVVSLVLDRLVLDEEASLVWTYVTQADIKAAGIAMAELDDLIDVVRTAREADVALVLKQQPDGRFKGSARSRGGHDVAAIAAAFGGGGHRLAAGFTSPDGMQESARRFAEALRAQRS